MSALYQSRHGSIAWVRQPSSKGGLSVGTPASVTATATDTDGVAVTTEDLGGTNASFVGDILECVSATSPENVGRRAMIKAFDSSSETFLVDKMPGIITTGDIFRHYTTPDAKVIVTTADTAGEGIITATGRSEAADTWNGTTEEGGYYVEAVNTDNIPNSELIRVTDSTSAGVVTLASNLSGNTAVGDFFRIVKFPDVHGASFIPPERQDIARESVVAGFGAEPSVAGNRSAAGALELVHRGPGRTRKGSKTDLWEMLSCVCDVNDCDDLTAHSGGSTTSVAYDAGTADVGDMFVTAEGDVFMAVADTGSAITPSPPLRSAPIEDTTITGGVVYTPSDVLNYALTMYTWRGNTIQEILYGCVPTPTFALEKNAYHKISCSLRAADWYQAGYGPTGAVLERGWYPRLPSVDAIKGRDARAVLYDHSAATPLTISLPLTSYSFDPGFEIVDLPNVCAPNDTDGSEIINSRAKGALKVRLNATTRPLLNSFLTKREMTLLIQVGSAPGYPGISGIWCYSVSLSAAPIGDDGGNLSLDLAFEVNRSEAGLALELPQWALMIA
jgi:hypothetical protein